MTDHTYISLTLICSSMAEPVLAFQFPEIDFLLSIHQSNHNIGNMHKH